MTCNITSTPLNIEPLPLYRRDPETVSIRSTAPSYVSEAPTYTSRRPSLLPASSVPSPGLPPARYAPGFRSRAHGSVGDIESHNYNVSHWSSIHSSHASRQYQAVAARRASKAASESAAQFSSSSMSTTSSSTASAGAGAGAVTSAATTLTTASSAPTAASPTSTTTTTTSPANNNTTTATNPSSSSFSPSSSTSPTSPAPDEPPLSPLEDPYLVGEYAAAQARARRIYRDMCLRGAEAVRHEGKAWDFMLAQMADWEERERSWKKFRAEVGRSKILGRRIGVGKW